MRKILGKNIYEKRVLATLAILIVAVAAGAGAFALQDFGSTSHLVASDAGGISEVWGINGTGSNPTYELATLTTSGNTVTASFGAGFNVTHIVVFEKNTKYDVQGLLNSSLYMSTLNVKVATENATDVSEPNYAALTSVVEAFGTQINDTSVHSVSDKGVGGANIYATLDVYNSTNSVNNLNQTLAFSLFGLGVSNFNDMLTITIGVHSNKTLASTNHLSFEITQTYGAPYTVNLINVFTAVLAVELLLAVLLMALGLPRIRGGK